VNEYQTEDFIFPKFADGRGTKIDRLPEATWSSGNEVEYTNITSSFEVSYDVDYTVDFNIEAVYYQEIGKAMMKSIDEEIMKVLMGDTLEEYVLTSQDKQFIADNEFISSEMLIEYVCGNLEKQDPKYSDYERAISIVNMEN
jgi:hypothetical protein